MNLRTRGIAVTLCLTTSLSIFAGTVPSSAYVARFVGPMLLKSLGGPWGLAVAFAAAAVGCRGAL